MCGRDPSTKLDPPGLEPRLHLARQAGSHCLPANLPCPPAGNDRAEGSGAVQRDTNRRRRPLRSDDPSPQGHLVERASFGQAAYSGEGGPLPAVITRIGGEGRHGITMPHIEWEVQGPRAERSAAPAPPIRTCRCRWRSGRGSPAARPSARRPCRARRSGRCRCRRSRGRSASADGSATRRDRPRRPCA